MTRNKYTESDETAVLGASLGDDDHLVHAASVLQDVETVLTRATTATATEISDILAEHGNHGGIGLLIDQVQFAHDYLTAKTH